MYSLTHLLNLSYLMFHVYDCKTYLLILCSMSYLYLHVCSWLSIHCWWWREKKVCGSEILTHTEEYIFMTYTRQQSWIGKSKGLNLIITANNGGNIWELVVKKSLVKNSRNEVLLAQNFWIMALYRIISETILMTKMFLVHVFTYL